MQERYWGSGVIFGYWTINQIPNFVLAAPILYVSYFAFFHYIQKTIHQKSYSCKYNGVLNYITSSLGLNYIVYYTSNLDLAMVGYLSHRSAPYVWHLFGLTSLIVVMAHVQINTSTMCIMPCRILVCSIYICAKESQYSKVFELLFDIYLAVLHLGLRAV